MKVPSIGSIVHYQCFHDSFCGQDCSTSLEDGVRAAIILAIKGGECVMRVFSPHGEDFRVVCEFDSQLDASREVLPMPGRWSWPPRVT